MIGQLRDLFRWWVMSKDELLKLIENDTLTISADSTSPRPVLNTEDFTVYAIVNKSFTNLIIYLKNGKGSSVSIPSLNVDNDAIRAMRVGWYVTDAWASKSSSAMHMHQDWQALVWPLLFPGARAYVLAKGVSITKRRSIRINWRVEIREGTEEAVDYCNAGCIAKLMDERLFFLALFTAVLGDGSVSAGVGDTRIRLVSSDMNSWRPVFERLRQYGIEGKSVETNGGSLA